MSDALKDRVRQRLDKLGLSARAASTSAGLAPDAIRNVLRERSKHPRGDTLRDLAKALNCSIHWLVTGEMEADVRGFDTGAEDRRDTCPIPEIEVRAGMGGGGEAQISYMPDGNGGVVAADGVRSIWAFPEDYIRSELRVNSGAARMIEVQGDSMEPTLRAGDRIMVDTVHKAPSPPGIYALWDGFGVIVKRVEHILNSDPPRLEIASDNGAHGSYERTFDEVNIIGRVVWYARRL